MKAKELQKFQWEKWREKEREAQKESTEDKEGGFQDWEEIISQNIWVTSWLSFIHLQSI